MHSFSFLIVFVWKMSYANLFLVRKGLHCSKVSVCSIFAKYAVYACSNTKKLRQVNKDLIKHLIYSLKIVKSHLIMDLWDFFNAHCIIISVIEIQEGING